MDGQRVYAGVDGDARRADRRRRLQDAAIDLLASGGAPAVAVTAVAERASLSPRYFYESFSNREALLAAIVDDEAERIIALIVTATSAADVDPGSRVEAAVGALLDLLERDPRLAQITRERGNDEVALKMLAALTSHLAAAFSANLELLFPAARAAPEQTDTFVSLAIGGVLQLVDDWLRDPSRRSRGEVVDLAVRFVLATAEVVGVG
jgi:AcrR family transcriptional regulator